MEGIWQPDPTNLFFTNLCNGELPVPFQGIVHFRQCAKDELILIAANTTFKLKGLLQLKIMKSRPIKVRTDF